ncbi:MAG TPA: TauD/TfdA family dioxygenase [Stellaceae bacterium]|nr:TauD/TfdA family dioxygenase [Stellaceae bacterium]
MATLFDVKRPLPGASFGGRLLLADAHRRSDPHAIIAVAEREPQLLTSALAECGGLLLLPGVDTIAGEPELLVQLSRFFGPEVEDYRRTLTRSNMVHESVPEIFVVSNIPSVGRAPPKRPDPPLTAEGKLPVQYPHRKGWHTDQSYRRPPPDISLFFAVEPVPQGQGQTLFADGAAAYEALPSGLKQRVDNLEGLHVQLGTGRSREAVAAGEPVRPLAPHERSQRQPVVRVHPVTGRKALYLCESGQMDWLDGPFVGMEPGPNGDGARLLDDLMAHLTRPEFIYVHEWSCGDLIVWDNRCLVHAATWFDAAKYERLMWRTTVHGNPGALYAGERKSWLVQTEAAAAQ